MSILTSEEIKKAYDDYGESHDKFTLIIYMPVVKSLLEKQERKTAEEIFKLLENWGSETKINYLITKGNYKAIKEKYGL